MTMHSLLLGYTAETSIHAGASTANHVIDLPIMREHSTGYPVVFGSAVKGALRAKAEAALEQDACFTLFGPDTNNAGDHAGSLLVGDARLLLLPMRSLTTQFRYVTCPNLLKRWQRDQARAGVTEVKLPTFSIKDEDVLVTKATKSKELFLEEFVFNCDGSKSEELNDLITALALISGRSEDEISSKLSIVSDDQFSLLCNTAIPVNAHIAIDNASKTVKPGALWYAESLPAETILYSVVASQHSRNKKFDKTSQELLEIFQNQVFGAYPYLQVGGNETTGMGWCKVQVQQGGE